MLEDSFEEWEHYCITARGFGGAQALANPHKYSLVISAPCVCWCVRARTSCSYRPLCLSLSPSAVLLHVTFSPMRCVSSTFFMCVCWRGSPLSSSSSCYLPPPPASPSPPSFSLCGCWKLFKDARGLNHFDIITWACLTQTNPKPIQKLTVRLCHSSFTSRRAAPGPGRLQTSKH